MDTNSKIHIQGTFLGQEINLTIQELGGENADNGEDKTDS